jgi:hypothetical protein
VDNLVSKQTLDENTNQPNQTILGLSILSIFTAGNATGDEKINIFWVQNWFLITIDIVGCEAIDNFHCVQTHIHPHQGRQVVILHRFGG